ncbi:hypothetical protein K437DRAFT_177883 [Tilletiaria anomala UBC 951]|uniref:Uncharacterized protein n=1 Tax=Tilletiaria anomala (strain ATCC 24038 / CBS 436.72 / UBC 951) TaxID=1037660 RepID=A0A066VHW5_TILAU|nr:uncharacterized protein K437DRAFT_177883 [Tilletiaria anomala UBC 951]KDN41312.1 hypothetical protein K437DRAFT_177883 [Tilletiaria anomala UBC 951]
MPSPLQVIVDARRSNRPVPSASAYPGSRTCLAMKGSSTRSRFLPSDSARQLAFLNIVWTGKRMSCCCRSKWSYQRQCRTARRFMPASRNRFLLCYGERAIAGCVCVGLGRRADHLSKERDRRLRPSYLRVRGFQRMHGHVKQTRPADFLQHFHESRIRYADPQPIFNFLTRTDFRQRRARVCSLRAQIGSDNLALQLHHVIGSQHRRRTIGFAPKSVQRGGRGVR